MVSSTIASADEGVQLGPAADRVPDHRAAATAADREAVEQAGRYVGRAERQELLAGVDRLAPSGREGPRGHNIVGVGDDGHAERGRHRVLRSSR